MTVLRSGGDGWKAARRIRPFVLFSTLDYYDRSCYCQGMRTPPNRETDPRDDESRGDEHRPSKGDASRATILHAAAKLATLRGLDGLSIGDLAAEVGMS